MNPNSETSTAKKFSFWFQNKLRSRIEALGFNPTNFINEAIIEKLAREEHPMMMYDGVKLNSVTEVDGGFPINVKNDGKVFKMKTTIQIPE